MVFLRKKYLCTFLKIFSQLHPFKEAASETVMENVMLIYP